MKATSQSTVTYRLKDNTGVAGVTQEQVQSIIDEMGIYGVVQYQKRSIIMDAITAAKTFEQVEAISW